MKTYLALLTFLATTSLIATAGCSDRAKDADPAVHATAATPPPASLVTPAAPEPVAVTVAAPATPGPFVEISAALEKCTMAQTTTLAGPQQNMERAINAGIDAWKATGATGTSKGEEKLALARTDFAQKLSALSSADDATWKSTKSEAMNSLDSLQQAYRELLAGPVKN